METPRHARLKVLTIRRLRAHGCCAVAAEVSCPHSRYRVDAAGFADPVKNGPNPGGGGTHATGILPLSPHRATTVIVECKQSRADFIRDSGALQGLLGERARLDLARRELEDRIIRTAEPHLARSGEMLFPQLESWDYAASRLPSYRRALRDLRIVDKKVHGQTKFWTIARYALADVLLIAAPMGLIRPAEVPPGWGLLEFPAGWLESADPPDQADLLGQAPILAPAERPSTDRCRARLLRNIAVAASRDAFRVQTPADSPTA